MIHVENPVEIVRVNTERAAQQILQTDMTNITLSQWQAEKRTDDDEGYVAYCAANRRLDPMEKPILLHVLASDFDTLKSMFQHVEYVAGGVN